MEGSGGRSVRESWTFGESRRRRRSRAAATDTRHRHRSRHPPDPS